MRSRQFEIPNISCGHCVKTIEREIGALEGVRSVRGEEKSRLVSVQWDEPPASWEAISRRLRELDYPPAPEGSAPS